MDNEAQSISIYVWDVEGPLVGVGAAGTVSAVAPLELGGDGVE